MTEQTTQHYNAERASLAYGCELRVQAIVDLACATATGELSSFDDFETLDCFMDSIRELDGDNVPAHIHPSLLPVATVLNQPLAGAPEDREAERARMDNNANALGDAGLLGLAVQFATPVRKYYSATSYSSSWGYYRTAWIYADTYQQAWELGAAWASAKHDQARAEAIAKVNPFFSGTYNGHVCFTQDAAERVQKVREFTAQQCQAALELPELQKSVTTAIHRRLAQLERADQD